MFSFIPIALAESPDATAVAQGQSGMVQIGLLVLMIAAFYFLLWRPQAKNAKMHREMIDNLKVGDEVVTAGGLRGKVKSIDDQVMIVALHPSWTEISLQKSSISSVLPRNTLSGESKSEPTKPEDSDNTQ